MKSLAKQNNQSLAPIPYDKFRNGAKSIQGPYNVHRVKKQGIYGKGVDILAMDLKSIKIYDKSS